MTRYTSRRERQEERWAQYGLIERQQDWQPGRRGSCTSRHPDTEDRKRIIRQTLVDQRRGRLRPTLFDAAGELLLHSYDLPKISLARQWLTTFCDDMIAIVSTRSRGARGPDVEPPGRQRIARFVRTGTDKFGLSSNSRDLLVATLLAANGQLTSQERPIGALQLRDLPQELSHVDWRHTRWLLEPQQTSDGHLAQVLVQARSVSPERTQQFVADFQTYYSIKPDDLVRGLLPTHRCGFHHTPAQAFIPHQALMLLNDPNALDDIGLELPVLVSSSSFGGQLGSLLAEIGGYQPTQ
jgi:hypothetical protein